MCAAMVMDGTTVTLLRHDDMLVVDIDFVNVRRTEAITGGMVLIPNNPATPAFITVTFPPQAVLEQARPQGGPAIAAIGARFSSSSRLTFRFPPGRSIPFTIAGLLSWAGLMNAPDRSTVECVWDLILRPAVPEAGWVHATMPVTTAAGVTELWHTRLTMGSQQPVPIGDVRSQGFDLPFRSSLTRQQRIEISQAAAVHPLLAHELTLSALGATVDLAGDWADLPQVDMMGYRHRAVLGRDESVSAAERGFLFPFGFPARLDTYTERRVGSGDDSDAALEQTTRLTVTTPEVRYDGAVGVPFEGRDLPFQRIRLDGPLTAEVSISDMDRLAEGVFWVNTPAGARLAVNLTAEQQGHTVSFSAPVAFVQQTYAFGGLRQAVLGYDQERQQAPAPATGRVSLVPAEGGADRAFDVTALYIGARVAEADPATLRTAGQLAALPRLVGVDARVPELEVFDRAARARNAAGVPTTLNLDPKYVERGPTRSGIYASLKTPVAFAPPPTSVGGIAALTLSVSGLSRTTGLVGGDLEAFRDGRFDPAKFLTPSLPGLLPPTLLGFVKLADLVHPANVGEGEVTPRIVTEVLHPDGNPSRSTVCSTVTWRPRIKTGLHAGTLRTTLDTTLDLRSTTSVDLGGGEPTSHVQGELRSFSLEFAGQALIVQFTRLAFGSRSGTPPMLDLKVADVRFGGDLRFLNALRRYLPSPPSGPRVAVTDGSIEASYTLAIPTLATGVFLLQNLALSASVTLPLDGRPVRARFAVSSREDPFLVTVSLFGGGGFIAVEVESDHVVALEAQLEFGAATALNLGIASASVAVTAGVYIRLIDGKAELRGFFRAVGELDVLGLVNVSVELYLSLSYRDGPGGPEAYGAAMVTIRVRVMFFSESVTLTLERSFGTGSDPTFDQAFPTPEPWRQRCAAFAPMVAS
jgi:hypothetical protein